MFATIGEACVAPTFMANDRQFECGGGGAYILSDGLTAASGPVTVRKRQQTLSFDEDRNNCSECTWICHYL